MANNPPTSAQARRRYRVEFIVIAIFLLGLTYFQAKRSKKEQVAATTEANKRTEDIKTQYDQLQGSINSLGQFIQHPPPGLTKEQVEAVVKAQLAGFRVPAVNTTPEPSSQPVAATPIPSAPLSPDVQALREQGLQEAKAIDDWIAVISKDAPVSNGSVPPADDLREKMAYVDRLNLEWKNNYAASAKSTVSNLHVQGLLRACLPNTGGTEPSEILLFRKICAQKIRETALSLR